jgi:DNA-binding MarR family transcriptional regulator
MNMSLFSPVDITPAIFTAMAPALKTEAVLLMAERGIVAADIAAATGMTRESLLSIGSQRHHVRAFEFERSAETMPRLKQGPKLSPAARMLLGHMHHNAGVLVDSLTTVSYDVGISEKSARAALQQLTTWGFIEKTRDGSGRVAAHYRLTAAGEALVPAAAPSTAEASGDA